MMRTSEAEKGCRRCHQNTFLTEDNVFQDKLFFVFFVKSRFLPLEKDANGYFCEMFTTYCFERFHRHIKPWSQSYDRELQRRRCKILPTTPRVT
jgi:hypothetical protein